jgi:Iodothyronine deiodinase
LSDEYRGKVAFYAVYILEAHPSDVWQMESNIRDSIVFLSPKNAGERSDLAQSCVRRLGLRFPAVVDTMDNRTEQAYTGWPDRIYLIDRDGKIAYTWLSSLEGELEQEAMTSLPSGPVPPYAKV